MRCLAEILFYVITALVAGSRARLQCDHQVQICTIAFSLERLHLVRLKR